MATPSPSVQVDSYLAGVDGARGDALRDVFDTVATAMPSGHELAFDGRFIPWEVPLSRFPITRNGRPLQFTALAAGTAYNSLHLNGDSSIPDARFRAAWAATGRRLDMGTSWLRFRRPADVDLALVASVVAAVPVQRFIDTYTRIQEEQRA